MELLRIISLLVPSEDVVGLGGAEGVAAHGVDGDERDEGGHEEEVGAAPLAPQVGEQAGLAGGAGVAQLRLVVAPQHAVDVGSRVDRADPVRRVHERVPAARRWLAASGLIIKERRKQKKTKFEIKK